MLNTINEIINNSYNMQDFITELNDVYEEAVLTLHEKGMVEYVDDEDRGTYVTFFNGWTITYIKPIDFLQFVDRKDNVVTFTATEDFYVTLDYKFLSSNVALAF